jgi:hypothetical protein
MSAAGQGILAMKELDGIALWCQGFRKERKATESMLKMKKARADCECEVEHTGTERIESMIF